MCKGALLEPGQVNTASEPNSDLHEMVRIGEYSPLNKYSSPTPGRTVLGVGEHEAKRIQLSEERRYEYLTYREKENLSTADKGVMVSTPNGRRSVSSTSTQTDEPHAQVESPTQINPSKMVTSPREFMDFSPREKLLSDLYGYRPNNDVAHEEKSKRLAYAQALQEQIKEKKRLEEERKRREKEEDELEERRYKQQAESIRKEYSHERRNLDLDFVTQRQTKEELLKKRLADMNMEGKELKMKERLSRLANKPDGSPDGSFSNISNVASANTTLQALEDVGRITQRDLVGAAPADVLPERLPEGSFQEDWSQMTRLEGVDLLREHRSQKERLQLPPVVDAITKVERKKPSSSERAPATAYVPSGLNDVMRRTQNVRQQADAILRAPLEEEITHYAATTQRSAVSLTPPQRPRSPVVPAIRTGSILKRNSRILEDKWKVPEGGHHDLGRTIVDRDNILTQLGAFRRQLAQEHHKLEERTRGQSSS